MKANIFLKENGLKKCSRIVEDLIEQGNDSEFVKNLKRIVESHELVSQFDDIGQAKAYLPEIDNDMPWGVKGGDLKFFHWQLEQAIADVESCL